MDIAITILISTPVLNTAVTDLWRRTSQRCDPEHVGHRKAPVASKRMAGAGTGVYAAMLVRGAQRQLHSTQRTFDATASVTQSIMAQA